MQKLVGVCCVVASLLVSVGLPRTAEAEGAVIRGFILDPANQPAEGFRVVIMDAATGTEFRSAPSNVVGEYAIEVPVDARYQLVYAVSPEGTEIPVQKVAPIYAGEAGTINLNVVFKSLTRSTPSFRPWWKKPGGVVGIVLGAVVTGVALGSDGDNPPPPPVSPSSP